MVSAGAKRSWALAFVAGLLLAACARLAYLGPALAYRHASSLIAWEVDAYADLSATQKAWLRARLDRELAWHRVQELPSYRRFLVSIAQRANAPFAPEDVAGAYTQLHDGYARLVGHLLPGMAELLVQLDEAQLRHLERKFDDDNRRILKESTKGTPASRRAELAKKALGHIEAWTGSLDAAQRALVAARIAAFPDVVQERLAERRYRQAETIALARTRDRERALAGLHRLLLETDAWRRAAYRDKLRERDRQIVLMIASLSATLTAAQRAHLESRIAGYIDDIDRETAR